MTTDYKKIKRIANDLSDQAERLNAYTSDSNISANERKEAGEKQIALYQQAADLRVQAMQLILTGTDIALEQVEEATDDAKDAAEKINKVKKALDLAALTIAFIANASAGNAQGTIDSFNSLKTEIEQYNA